MKKGQSHEVPPERALRIKWMRMMAKCNMTESTVSRPHQANSDGEIPSEVWSLQLPRVATSCLFCWYIVAAIWMERDDMRDERIMS